MGFCTFCILFVIVFIAMVLMFLPKYFIGDNEQEYIVLSKGVTDSTGTVNVACNDKFFELRTESYAVYEGYLNDKAEAVEICEEIAAEVIGTRRYG